MFAFKCEWESICSFWNFADGANRVLSLPRKELGDTITMPPAVDAQEDGEALIVLPELGGVRWLVQDDGAPVELEGSFYDDYRYDDMPDDITVPHKWASKWLTKFGGVPCWTSNGAQGQPRQDVCCYKSTVGCRWSMAAKLSKSQTSAQTVQPIFLSTVQSHYLCFR